MRLPIFPCILTLLDLAAAVEALWRRCPAPTDELVTFGYLPAAGGAA